MKANPLTGMTPDEIGQAVAQALEWDGSAIFAAMLEALTDSNFHRAAAKLAKTWQALETN